MATKGTSPVITHTGANIALTFKRASQVVDNVVVRTSQRGIWFHSNPASTDDQTLSFYGARITNFGFQHGISGASYGIYVGDGARADNLYNCDRWGGGKLGVTAQLFTWRIKRELMALLTSDMMALLQAQ